MATVVLLGSLDPQQALTTVALAAVLGIGGRVDAGPVALRFVVGAAALTLAAGGTSGTNGVAVAAVSRIARGVDAAASEIDNGMTSAVVISVMIALKSSSLLWKW